MSERFPYMKSTVDWKSYCQLAGWMGEEMRRKDKGRRSSTTSSYKKITSSELHRRGIDGLGSVPGTQEPENGQISSRAGPRTALKFMSILEPEPELPENICEFMNRNRNCQII